MANHTYNNGQPYQIARGRMERKADVERRVSTCHSIVRGKPTAEQFIQAVQRELKIRAYQPRTIKTYVVCVRNFLQWFGQKPNRVTIEAVRAFLELLVDGGANSSTLAVYLSAIRTAFDKFCGRDVTLGLVTPRRPSRLPVVPSQKDVLRLMDASANLRDKLLIGVLYATGCRVSEVCALKWSDVDFDRNLIWVRSGKGRKDRTVCLPMSYKQLLKRLAEFVEFQGYIFAGNRTSKYISSRTVQRVIHAATKMAGITKNITPHCLRHAFATHLLENGTDVRFIQKLLGHKNLETTTIYTRVAKPSQSAIASPLDAIVRTANSGVIPDGGSDSISIGHEGQKAKESWDAEKPIGSLQVQLEMRGDNAAVAAVKVTRKERVYLLRGIELRVEVGNWVRIEMPVFDNWLSELGQDSELIKRVQSSQFFETMRNALVREFMAKTMSVAAPMASRYGSSHLLAS